MTKIIFWEHPCPIPVIKIHLESYFAPCNVRITWGKIILDRFWGEKAYYNRAKDQIEFLGKQKKPYYDGIVSALQYVALYEPEKLILEEYEIARTLFDNDSKFNRPTALQVISTAFLLLRFLGPKLFRLIIFSVYCNRSAVKYGWSDLYSISISNCFWNYQKMFRFWTKDLLYWGSEHCSTSFGTFFP